MSDKQINKKYFCKNCVYMKVKIDKGFSNFRGSCTRFPPLSSISTNGRDTDGYPTVWNLTTSCGEFKSNEEQT